MKITLLIFFFVLLIALYYFFPFYRALKISTLIEASTVPFEQHPSSSVMKILIAGDSTGYGTGAAKPEDSTAGQLGQKYPSADIMNISENGLTTEEIKLKLEKINGKFDLILLQTGANDIIKQTPNKKIKNELQSLLKIATNKSDKVIILTAGNIGLSLVFRWPVSNFFTSKTKQVREIFIQETSMYENVTYIDLFKEKEDDIFITDVPKYYAKDRFHPSSEGYKVWFKEIEKEL